VLVIDDDTDLSWIVGEILRTEGHQVRSAADGEQGLRELRDQLPDLVVLDVEMPLLDGTAVAAQMIVEDCGMECIPIVLLSGVADLAPVIERVGTPYVLRKPCDLNRFLSLVRRALREHEAPQPKSDLQEMQPFT
jgi:DNA-binding response OmpR family regulator